MGRRWLAGAGTLIALAGGCAGASPAAAFTVSRTVVVHLGGRIHFYPGWSSLPGTGGGGSFAYWDNRSTCSSSQGLAAPTAENCPFVVGYGTWDLIGCATGTLSGTMWVWSDREGLITFDFSSQIAAGAGQWQVQRAWSEDTPDGTGTASVVMTHLRDGQQECTGASNDWDVRGPIALTLFDEPSPSAPQLPV